jgi:hypothetical protein
MVIVTIIALLALFSLISYRLGTDDGAQGIPDRDQEAMFWMRFGSH